MFDWKLSTEGFYSSYLVAMGYETGDGHHVARDKKCVRLQKKSDPQNSTAAVESADRYEILCSKITSYSYFIE